MSLKGFEDQTHDLNDYELNTIIPILINGFKKRIGKNNSITNPEICKILSERYGIKKIQEPRIRKCIHYIRQKNCVPKLIATSKGYWIATNKQELLDWKGTLEGRIRAMQMTLDYANQQIENWDKPNGDNQSKLF